MKPRIYKRAKLWYCSASGHLTGIGYKASDAYDEWLRINEKDGAKVPSARQLTPDQLVWHGAWQGGTLAVVDGPEAALRVLAVMQS